MCPTVGQVLPFVTAHQCVKTCTAVFLQYLFRDAVKTHPLQSGTVVLVEAAFTDACQFACHFAQADALQSLDDALTTRHEGSQHLTAVLAYSLSFCTDYGIHQRVTAFHYLLTAVAVILQMADDISSILVFQHFTQLTLTYIGYSPLKSNGVAHFRACDETASRGTRHLCHEFTQCPDTDIAQQLLSEFCRRRFGVCLAGHLTQTSRHSFGKAHRLTTHQTQLKHKVHISCRCTSGSRP